MYRLLPEPPHDTPTREFHRWNLLLRHNASTIFRIYSLLRNWEELCTSLNSREKESEKESRESRPPRKPRAHGLVREIQRGLSGPKDDWRRSGGGRKGRAWWLVSGCPPAARPSQTLRQSPPAAWDRRIASPIGDWIRCPCIECPNLGAAPALLAASPSGPIPGRCWHLQPHAGDRDRKHRR